jgi:pimeloyl-ACP methyl ester carboxylesterase
MSEDTATLMEQIGIKNAHILGASMGGMIAQELAINHPEKILKLVLACTTCGGPNSVGIEEAGDTFERVFNPKPGDSPQDLLGCARAVKFV